MVSRGSPHVFSSQPQSIDHDCFSNSLYYIHVSPLRVTCQLWLRVLLLWEYRWCVDQEIGQPIEHCLNYKHKNGHNVVQMCYSLYLSVEWGKKSFFSSFLNQKVTSQSKLGLKRPHIFSLLLLALGWRMRDHVEQKHAIASEAILDQPVPSWSAG